MEIPMIPGAMNSSIPLQDCVYKQQILVIVDSWYVQIDKFPHHPIRTNQRTTIEMTSTQEQLQSILRDANAISFKQCYKKFKTLLKCVESSQYFRNCLIEEMEYFECKEEALINTNLWSNEIGKDVRSKLAQETIKIEHEAFAATDTAFEQLYVKGKSSPCFLENVLSANCNSHGLNWLDTNMQPRCIKATKKALICVLNANNYHGEAEKLDNCFTSEFRKNETYDAPELADKLTKCEKFVNEKLDNKAN